MALLLCCLAPATAGGQVGMSILNSKHNLSATGPGTVRAAGEEQVCIFCHTPHNASAIQPLWNRNLPMEAYSVYASTSLDAAPGQPTGSSKLCLSCHDGTIAVGSVVSRSQPIAMAGGMTTLPPGSKGHLGTDLRDDHPISFRYDSTLAARDPKLKDPAVLPAKVKLDHQHEVQCTTCHDAHDDTFGKFLVMDNSQSQLCQSCHQPRPTSIAAHDNCTGCHQPHSAPSGPLLLRGINPTETCGTCHGGSVAGTSEHVIPGPDIMTDIAKFSRHAPQAAALPGGQHPGADASCSACHEPHTMQAGTAPAPQVSPRLGQIDGVNASGAPVKLAQFEYEVCYKCHAENAVGQPFLSRQITTHNTRLEFDPAAASYHPITAAGKSADVPSLRAGLTTGSTIACGDCHASDSARSGPHGSNTAPLLAAGYETQDGAPESEAGYALCYRCHDRGSLLSNESFSAHSLHIVDQRTPCSACHDAHGIPSAQGTRLNHAALMNFDTRIVQPDPATGRLEYRSLGARSGECYLTCHGVAHSPKAYPFVEEPPVEQPPVVEPPPAAPLPGDGVITPTDPAAPASPLVMPKAPARWRPRR